MFLRSNFSSFTCLFHNICYLLSDFHVNIGTKFALRDKRLFEASEVDIMRVDTDSISKQLYDGTMTQRTSKVTEPVREQKKSVL